MLIRRAQYLCALTLVVFLSWGCATAFGEASSWQLQASHAGGFTGGISCWSTSSCETVGSFGSVPEYIDGQVRIRNHAPGTGFGQLACAAGRCLSVGSSPRKGFHATLQWSTNGRFGPVKRFQPRATRRFKGTLLPVAASCPARGDCYVIGQAGAVIKTKCTTSGGTSKGGTSVTSVSCEWSSGGGVPIVLHWNGHVWSGSTRLPLPRAAAAAKGGAAVALLDIACATRISCEAIGLWSPKRNDVSRPFAEHWNGRRWSAQAMPMPPAAAHGQLRGLLLFGDLSCPTAGVCMVVGNRGLPIGRRGGYAGRPFAMRHERGRWSLVAPPPVKSMLPSSFDCMTAERCMMVGSVRRGRSQRSVSELWTPSGWSALAVPSVGQGFLTGISCGSATTCEAVGTYFGSKGMGWFLDRYAPSP